MPSPARCSGCRCRWPCVASPSDLLPAPLARRDPVRVRVRARSWRRGTNREGADGGGGGHSSTSVDACVTLQAVLRKARPTGTATWCASGANQTHAHRLQRQHKAEGRGEHTKPRRVPLRAKEPVENRVLAALWWRKIKLQTPRDDRVRLPSSRCSRMPRRSCAFTAGTARPLAWPARRRWCPVRARIPACCSPGS